MQQCSGIQFKLKKQTKQNMTTSYWDQIQIFQDT